MGSPDHGTATPQSLSTFRAERAVDALTPAFVRWFEEASPGSAAAALECQVQIKAVMGRYMEKTAAADETNLDLGGLSVALSREVLAIVDASETLCWTADVGTFPAQPPCQLTGSSLSP